MKLGKKSQKALSIGKKGLVIAGAVGGLLGLGVKATHKVEDKVENKIKEVKEDAEVAGVVAGAVVDAGVQAGKDALANPLQAKKKIELGKDKVVGLKKAAELVADDRTARKQLADTIDFQRNPTNPPEPRVKRDSRYGTPDAGGTGSRRDTQDTTRAGDIDGMINTCKFKYKKKTNPNDRRKCIKRVKDGGRP